MIVYDKNIFGSNREIDSNGYLRVDSCNITKTQVAPYLGREIPGWQEMGLDAEKIYYVLRPEDELKKAVPTFNNLPLTREHIEVDVENVPKEKIVGSLGDHTEFVDGYLRNNLIIYDKKDIDLVMSGKKKELSCGYRYTPVREHGTFNGQDYDFVMKDIIGNHVALVKEGRAGHDVVVSDTISKVKEKFMSWFRKNEIVCDEKEKEDDVEWITVRGNHIPVKKGQSKTDAIGNFFKSVRESNEKQFNESFEREKSFRKSAEESNKKGSKEETEHFIKMAESERNIQNEITERMIKAQKEEEESSKEENDKENEDYVKRGEELKKEFPDFDVASPEQFKEFTGLTPAEFERKYPSRIKEGEKSSKESKSDLKGKSFKVKLARKPSDLSEVKNLDIDHPNDDVKISETIELSEKDYNDFVKNPLRDHDFLKGKGGYDDDGNRTGVAIRSKGKQTLVVDPSGSAYARYMGILYADEDNIGANDEKLSDSEKEKVGVVMKEFKEGELKSGSGEKVTDPKQAIAIALSEAGKAKDEKDIPDEQEKPEKAGEENALVKGEEEMTEEVKEALAEKEVEKVKEAEDACGKAKDEKDEKLESKKDFAEGVKYGEEKEKEEPKKLDSEHESEGAKKADEEEAKKKKEAEDEDKEEKKEDKMAKDSALAMDIDAIKQAVREEMKADFKAREDARKAVRSIVGDVNVMTFDSAEDIYKFACEQAGMDVNDIVSYKDAFKGLTAGKSKLALDASSISGSNEECFADIRIA